MWYSIFVLLICSSTLVFGQEDSDLEERLQNLEERTSHLESDFNYKSEDFHITLQELEMRMGGLANREDMDWWNHYLEDRDNQYQNDMNHKVDYVSNRLENEIWELREEINMRIQELEMRMQDMASREDIESMVIELNALETRMGMEHTSIREGMGMQNMDLESKISELEEKINAIEN